MKRKYLIDSDVIIWYLRGRSSEKLLIDKLNQNSELYISVMTLGEVRTGLSKEQLYLLEKIKKAFKSLPIDESVAVLAGEFRQRYRLDIADMCIAATAVLQKAILVTYNKKHFPMPEVKLYHE